MPRADAEDLVGEAFAALLLQKEQPADPTAWVLVAARRREIGQWRWRRRHVRVPLDEFDVAAESATEPARSGELWEILTQLPDRDREVLLRYAAGGTSAEQARDCRIRASSYQTTLNRAMERARRVARGLPPTLGKRWTTCLRQGKAA
jgi:DNA-directed RNA polymerase specialized sigma24 family protein